METRESFDRGDGSEGNRADEADSIESVLESAEDTETIVEKLRESGTRYHVSESNVDDVVDSIQSPDDDTDSDSDPFSLDGGPTRTTVSDGIDEVFAELESAVDDRDEESIEPSATVERRSDDQAASPFAAAAEEPDFDELKREYGTLSGREPAKTISDESVDDILALAADDGDRSPASGGDGSSARDDAATGVEADRSEGTAPEAIQPDDPEAAMTSLFDDGTSPDGADPTTESPGE